MEQDTLLPEKVDKGHRQMQSERHYPPDLWGKARIPIAFYREKCYNFQEITAQMIRKPCPTGTGGIYERYGIQGTDDRR